MRHIRARHSSETIQHNQVKGLKQIERQNSRQSNAITQDIQWQNSRQSNEILEKILVEDNQVKRVKTVKTHQTVQPIALECH